MPIAIYIQNAVLSSNTVFKVQNEKFFFLGGGVEAGEGRGPILRAGRKWEFKFQNLLALRIIGFFSLLKSISPFCALATGGFVGLMGPSAPRYK